MGFEIWQTILVAAIPTAIGIFLTFILGRNREASGLAQQAISSTKSYFGIIETLKTVAFLQGQRIDQWEDWGRNSMQAWRAVRQYIIDHGECPEKELPVIPDMPDLHLDLTRYWNDIQSVIDSEKSQETAKVTRRQFGL
jgi:hypothetical protein